MKNVAVSCFIAFILLATACRKGTHLTIIGETSFLPPISYPDDNTFSPERYALGKALFFDPRFSADGLVSCASCHQPHMYFADDKPVSPGSNEAPGTRNVPSLVNIAFHPYFTREGGVPTLEMHVLVPIQEHNEFNNNILLIADLLNQDSLLRNMSLLAYNQEITPYTITRSLANFQRQLISNNAPYDRALRGQTQLTTAQERGRQLFFSSSTGCVDCHGGFNFTNYQIVNNGLYSQYNDPGLARLTGLAADSGKFKVPSLRNIAQTAPFMHDGSLANLEEVIDHYNSGGKPHPSKDNRIKPLNLSEQNKADLIAFLESLTDDTFEMP